MRCHRCLEPALVRDGHYVSHATAAGHWCPESGQPTPQEVEVKERARPVQREERIPYALVGRPRRRPGAHKGDYV